MSTPFIAPATLNPRLNAIAFWDRFHREVDHRVRQFSRMPGKPPLTTRSCGAFVHRIDVELAERPSCRVECRFSLDRGQLECRLGPALQPGAFRFRWIPGEGDVLETGGERFMLEAAIGLILDKLTGSVADPVRPGPGQG